jgi:hypothetical protein
MMPSPITLEQSFDLFTGVDSPGPATRFVSEQREQLLASELEELAGLRFSIIITAKWESSGDEDPQRLEELRIELDDLRKRYFNKIDEIAMTFSVAQAILAKEEVERNVTIPLGGLGVSDAELEAAFGSAPEIAPDTAPDSAPGSSPQPADDGLFF